MVLRRWLVEAMKVVGIVDNIVNLFKKRKETWRTELLACNESLVWKFIIGEGSFREILFKLYFFCCSYTFINNLECERPQMCNKLKSKIKSCLVYG